MCVDHNTMATILNIMFRLYLSTEQRSELRHHLVLRKCYNAALQERMDI